MTTPDDIVTRLRAQSAFNKNHRFGDLLDDWAGEAADEIERLRFLVYRWETCQMVTEGLCGWDSEQTLCNSCKAGRHD